MKDDMLLIAFDLICKANNIFAFFNMFFMIQLDLRPRWPLGEEYAEGKSQARSLRRARMHPSLTSIIQQKKPKTAV